MSGDGFRVAVLGGGAWGTALALAMLRAGHAVSLWARDIQTVEAIGRGENPRYLPGIPIEHGIGATADISVALAGAAVVAAHRGAPEVCAAVGLDISAQLAVVLR